MNQGHLKLQKKFFLKVFLKKKFNEKNAYHTILINGNPMINNFSIKFMALLDKHFLYGIA